MNGAHGRKMDGRRVRRAAGPQVASKLDKDDVAKIEKEVNDCISWLDANQLAEVEELEDKLKSLESTCSPIISKMYQGGARVAPPGRAGRPVHPSRPKAPARVQALVAGGVFFTLGIFIWRVQQFTCCGDEDLEVWSAVL